MNTVGDTLKETSSIEMISFEDSINHETNKHLNYRVKGKRLGDFEVRLRKVSKEIETQELTNVEFEYKLIGWFYSLVNNSQFQRTPISYHYKITTLPMNFVQIFDCQQYVGYHFLKEIIAQMNNHAIKQQGKSQGGSPRIPSKVNSPQLNNNSVILNNSSQFGGSSSQVFLIIMK